MHKLSPTLLTGDVVLYYSPFSFSPTKFKRWGNHAGVAVCNHGTFAINEYDGTVRPSPISDLEGVEVVILRRPSTYESKPERMLEQVKFGIKANAFWGCTEEDVTVYSSEPGVGYIAACLGLDWVQTIEDLIDFPELEVVYKGVFSVKLLKTT